MASSQLNDPNLYANLKCVVVTGSTSGLGLLLAKSLFEDGKKVIVCGRRQDRLDTIAAQYKGVQTYKLDVSSRSDCEQFAQKVIKEHPEVNGLVNNAGIQKSLDFTKIANGQSMSDADWEEEVNINIMGLIRLTNLFLGHFRAQEHAYVMNVSSGLSLTPAAAMPVYSATKAFVHSFSRSLRHQLRNTNVKVVEIIPPAVESELNPEMRNAPENKEMLAKVMMSGADWDKACMGALKKGELEFGAGFVTHALSATREGEYKSFNMMNPS